MGKVNLKAAKATAISVILFFVVYIAPAIVLQSGWYIPFALIGTIFAISLGALIVAIYQLFTLFVENK